MIPQSYTLSAYSYLLLYRLREGLCNKKARFQESRFFEYSIAHLTLITARKRHNARDVPSALPIHFLLYQMNASAYFNRRSPRGERLAQQPCCCETNRFQSTLPAGERRLLQYFCLLWDYFNPRSPWGGSDPPVPLFPKGSKGISIHAPRGGSDAGTMARSMILIISIHAPRGGSDMTKFLVIKSVTRFQSTLPAGGATNAFDILSSKIRISIHAPRGGSDDIVYGEICGI